MCTFELYISIPIPIRIIHVYPWLSVYSSTFLERRGEKEQKTERKTKIMLREQLRGETWKGIERWLGGAGKAW